MIDVVMFLVVLMIGAVLTVRVVAPLGVWLGNWTYDRWSGQIDALTDAIDWLGGRSN